MASFNKQQMADKRLYGAGLLCFGFILYSIFCLSAVCVEGMLRVSEASAWSPEEVLKEYVLDNYPWTEVEVKDVRANGTLSAAPPERIMTEKGPLGIAVFSMLFKNNESVKVSARVKALDWIVKSKRPFRRGHQIRDDDIYLTLMDVTKMPKSAIMRSERLEGKTLKRSVLANRAITEDMLQAGTRVRRGKKVTLLLVSDGFRITTQGRLKQVGYIGQQVKVTNLTSNKVVKGTLVDENTVEVAF